MTVQQAVVLLLSASVIAVLVERCFPNWDALSPARKKSVLAVINTLASVALAVFAQTVPSDVQAEPVAVLVQTVLMYAATFIAHQIDAWLEAKKQAAQADAETAKLYSSKP